MGPGGFEDINLLNLTNGDHADAPRHSMAQIKEMRLGYNVTKPSAKYFKVLGSVINFKHSDERKPWYWAVPDVDNTNSSAKVVPIDNNKFYCEKNDKIYDSYISRWVLYFNIADCTGNIWITAFNETATKFLNISAYDAELLSQTNKEKYEQIFQAARNKDYVFCCRVYSTIWEDTKQIKYECIDVKPIDINLESEILLENINFLQNL
ncbi:MAG: hypothetical protein GY928_00845 [Colwellia sp.]|nr:hypothetical protein [Colwellia sp.]